VAVEALSVGMAGRPARPFEAQRRPLLRFSDELIPDIEDRSNL